jgi:hypothetical protein
LFKEEVESLQVKVKLIIETSTLKPEEIESEKEFYEKIHTIEFDKFCENLKRDLEDASYALNR